MDNPYAHYDDFYSQNESYFGNQPDNLLKDYYSLCDIKDKVLDIGIGQGRNAKFLLKHGYSIDGIDPSKVAIENLTEWAKAENKQLKLSNVSFCDYSCAPRAYSAIMVFGVFPELSIEQIKELARKAKRWLKSNGIVFITGFTTKEKVFRPTTPEWKQLTENTYAAGKDKFRTFMDADEAIAQFRRFKTVYQWEGYGQIHSHGADTEEQHHIFELILQKV